MTEKYKVTQEFMDALIKWAGTMPLEYVSRASVVNLPNKVIEWWLSKNDNLFETNRRLIAIIQWANGEDVFEIEKPQKFVVSLPVGDWYNDMTAYYMRDQENLNAFTPDIDMALRMTEEEADELASGLSAFHAQKEQEEE